MPRFGKHPAHSRLRQLARKIDPPKPPPPPVVGRFLHDGEHVERLPDAAPAELPPGAFRVERVIVDPPAPEDDDADVPLGGVVHNTTASAERFPPIRAPKPEPPAEEHSILAEFEDDEPAPHAPRSKPRRKSPEQQRQEQARDSFERRTKHWADQGLSRPAKKRRGIDRAPNERAELKQAAKEGRVRVRGVELLGSRSPRR